ncbi:LysR family transcriptional regulator [Rhodobacter sp. Har01]|uniref:LysR family transcriptional regulator n=1 Tax=Rhodobacter sp. Har01 TaxID=2883999 RepID=UPI001D07FB1A|nr:LysR family transcriptional regulator [Rhodobacter sp. Har01]MCB6176857.1 LysR family transcriptional regulator [Rhodobacter sp. Har01]
MQIELIDTFLDLVETKSFNRTADRTGVTQSTVSARVKSLEQMLGARLFRRSRAGTDLTTEGLRFETHARLLRQEWTAARRAVAASGEAAMTLRLGIQNDLTTAYLGPLVAEIRRVLPQTALYVEPDYSTQMCADLVTGALDFAVLFSPKPHPDLHFQSVGELTYRLISSDSARIDQIAVARMIFAHVSPAFERAHREALPNLSEAPLSVGQTAAVVSLLEAMGGAGYVLDTTAQAMTQTGRFRMVDDAPVLSQPVYATMHLRNRTARLHRRLTRILVRQLSGRTG